MVGGRLIRRVAIRAARRTAVRAIRCVARRELRPTAVRPVAIRVGLAMLIDVSLIAGAVGIVVSITIRLAVIAWVLTGWVSRARCSALVSGCILAARRMIRRRAAVVASGIDRGPVAVRRVRLARGTAYHRPIWIIGAADFRRARSGMVLDGTGTVTRFANTASAGSGVVGRTSHP